MARHITLLPAYGRDYTSADEARDSWERGDDWRSAQGPYTSSRESDFIIASGFNSVRLRFAGSEQFLDIAL